MDLEIQFRYINDTLVLGFVKISSKTSCDDSGVQGERSM